MNPQDFARFKNTGEREKWEKRRRIPHIRLMCGTPFPAFSISPNLYSLCPLWLSVFIGTQPPKLEIPKVVIYGERKVEIEVLKRELIPDTIPLYELPKLQPPRLVFKKSSGVSKYKSRNSLFSLKGSVGGSGMIKGFYGKDWFSAGVSYLNKLKGIENSWGLNAGGDFKNLSFGANGSWQKYKEDAEYRVFKTTAGYTLPSFSFKTTGCFGNWDGETKANETALVAYGDYLIPLKWMNPRVDFYVAHDNLLDSLVLSVGGKATGNFKGWLIEPGIKCFSQSPWVQLSFRLEKVGVQNFEPLLIWIEYSPSFSLRTWDEALKYNRFVRPEAHIDKRKPLRMGVGTRHGVSLQVEWIQDYPYFIYYNPSGIKCIPPNISSQSDTTVLTVSGSVEQEFEIMELAPLYMEAGIRYNIDGAPEYIPKIILGLNLEWWNYKLKLDYGWHSDYNYLDFEVSWMVHENLTVFLDARNLFDEDTPIFDVYYEPGRKILLGIDLKL